MPGSEQNLKTVVELFTPSVAYPTGGFSFVSQKLAHLQYAGVLEGPAGYAGRATSTSGNAVRIEVYYPAGSGQAAVEIAGATNAASGLQIKTILMGV